MSVQTQIDRLAAAKTAIKSAIEGKGVTVPDATTLDGFAALIEAIEAGGESGDVITGTFTPAQAGVTSINLSEYKKIGPSKVPKARFIFEDSGIGGSDTSHTSKRVLSVFHLVSDETKTYQTQSYSSIALYQQSGSNSLLAEKSNVELFWYATSAYTQTYSFLTGRLSSFASKLFINSIEATDTYNVGCIVGRTYRWGIII